MRRRSTIILIAFTVALAGYFFLVERPRQRELERRRTAEVELASFVMDGVGGVTIARVDDTLEFHRETEGGPWLMEAPVADRAEDGAVNRLLGVLADGEIERDLGPRADLSPYGLDRPVAAITVTTLDGDTVVDLDVGDLTPEKYYAYARRRGAGPGAGVLLIPTGVRRYSLGEAFTYRNDRLIEFDLASVSGFTVSGPGGGMSWQKDAAGEWSTVVGSDTVRGHKPVLDEMVRRIQSMRAEEFVPASEIDAVQPFDAPARSISVYEEDRDRRTVRIGRQVDDRVYAGSRPLEGAGERVVLTDKKVLDLFDQTVFDLRDRRLLHFDFKELGRVVFESPEVTVTLVRPGSEWAFPNPSAEGPDAQMVQRVLSEMAELEHGRLLEPREAASYDLSNAEIRLNIYGKEGSLIDRLRATRAGRTAGWYAVGSGSSGVTAELAANALETIISGFKELRQP